MDCKIHPFYLRCNEMANRDKALRVALKWLRKIDPSGKSATEFEKMWSKLSDSQVANYIDKLDKGEDFIPVIYENMTESPITTKRNLAIGEEMGVKFHQPLIVKDQTTGRLFKTPERYLVMHVPVRRLVQSREDKWSIPEHNNTLDDLTNQPTRESAGSSISFPETMALVSQQQDRAIEEFLKLRGGDLRAYNLMERQIALTGECDASEIMEMGTIPKAVHTASVLLTGMHFDNTLTGRQIPKVEIE